MRQPTKLTSEDRQAVVQEAKRSALRARKFSQAQMETADKEARKAGFPGGYQEFLNFCVRNPDAHEATFLKHVGEVHSRPGEATSGMHVGGFQSRAAAKAAARLRRQEAVKARAAGTMSADDALQADSRDSTLGDMFK
jgi:hypothetical protein